MCFHNYAAFVYRASYALFMLKINANKYTLHTDFLYAVTTGISPENSGIYGGGENSLYGDHFVFNGPNNHFNHILDIDIVILF